MTEKENKEKILELLENLWIEYKYKYFRCPEMESCREESKERALKGEGFLAALNFIQEFYDKTNPTP